MSNKDLAEYDAELREEATNGIRAALKLMNEDPDRDGLQKTPARVLKAWLEMSAPLETAPEDLLSVTFDCKNVDQMVTVGPIPFTSLCEHHLMPFDGVGYISYLPTTGRVVGLSKLPRLLNYYANRPQVQERIAQQVTDAITEYLAPDAACVLDAGHTCMTARGVRKRGTVMRATSLAGMYREDGAARQELFAAIGPLREV